MKRKIIKLAEKTLVISLPAPWIQAHHLQKGQELEVVIDGERLVLQTPHTQQTKTSIELDAKHISDRVLRWMISSYHKQGYDELIILNYSSEHYTLIEELTRDLFIGFLVKEKTQLRIIVGQVAAVEIEEFDATLRRGFHHILQMAKELFTAFRKQDTALLASQLAHEQTNNKITNFCERLLNQSLSLKEKSHFWYVVAWNLEKLADSFKYCALHYADALQISASVLELETLFLEYLEGYAQLLYSFDFSTLVRLSEQKKELETKLVNLLIQGEQQDRVLVHYLHQAVLQIADFSASFVALQEQ